MLKRNVPLMSRHPREAYLFALSPEISGKKLEVSLREGWQPVARVLQGGEKSINQRIEGFRFSGCNIRPS